MSATANSKLSGSAQRDRRRNAEQLAEAALAKHRAREFDAAEKLYLEALALEPQLLAALRGRSALMLQGKRPDIAETLLRDALRQEPRHPHTLNNLALALADLRRPDEALEVMREVVRLVPNSPDFLGNLGRLLRNRKYYQEAVEAFDKATQLAPERPGLWSGLGSAYSGLEKHDEALDAHRKALELAPDSADLRNNFALALQAAKRPEEAEEQFREAIDLEPESPYFRVALGRALHDDGKYGDAIQVYRGAKEKGSTAGNIDGMLLFFQNHLLQHKPETLKADAVDWARRASVGITPLASWDNERTTDRPIRVGLVSGDFRGHPVGRFLEAPLKQIDRHVVRLFAYSADDNGDPINQNLRRTIPNWRSTKGVSDDDMVKMIRDDRIDILVDLSGHTALNRMVPFFHKPAPIAVTWLGFFATTGIAQIDYVLCNNWLIPPDEESHWVEKPWRLPSAHWCYKEMSIKTAVAPTPALKNGYVTFGCYNNFDKVNADTVATWARILDTVPNSRMLLRSGQKREGVKRGMLENFAKAGYEEGERLQIIAEAYGYEQHMESYGLLDVALDPFPYNGGTTTVEALYMGAPVLTMHGDRFVAHMAESNIRSAGLDEWVAADMDDYVRRAAELTADVPRLAALREGLREQVLKSRLFDAKAFAGDLEQAFTGMWAKWLAEQKNGPAAEPATLSPAS